MYKKKRAQVTVYIIIGLIILFLAILIFYLRGRTEGDMGMQGILRTQQIPIEARPITNYVTTQLDDATKEGLFLIGKQGGYIYESQGVQGISDPTEEGDFVLYKDHKVSYNIYKYNNNLYSYYFYEPKNYPWFYYPYSHFPESNEEGFFGGFFGTTNLPPLTGNSPSIQFQLTEFITNYLQEHIDFSIFDTQGFEIDEGEINVSVVIGENDVIVFLEYPLGIKKKITNTITNVSYFYINPQIRLKTIYNFTDDLINRDSTDILFNISNTQNNKNNMYIEKHENVYKNEDIIIIYDTKSMLYAEPYSFQFARENRYPALRYIPLSQKVFEGMEAVNNAKITESLVNPKADDPDEDIIEFTYEPHLPYSITASDFVNGYVNIKVFAMEKNNLESYDWQELKILITGEEEATYLEQT